MPHKRLGKGLDALIGGAGRGQEIAEVEISKLHPGRHQPREHPGEESLKELAASIKETGILQPVVVRRDGKGYEIIAGQRRWRAAAMAGLTTVPVVVRDVSDEEALIIALVENVQREDLNPVEKARAFKKLVETLGVTQAQAAARLGISRVALSNTLRLLELPSEVKALLAGGKLTAGHGRALLMIKNASRIKSLAKRIVRDGLSVRQVEEAARGRVRKAGSKAQRRVKKEAQILVIEGELSELLGRRVRIEKSAKGGRLVMEYYSPDDFEDLLRIVRKGARGSRQQS